MKYILYWKTGEKEIIEGDSIFKALASIGYNAEATRELDFCTEEDDLEEYKYVKEQGRWMVKNSQSIGGS